MTTVFNYACGYDGYKCDKVVPSFEGNVLVNPPNAEIKEKYAGIISELRLDESWDACDSCPRNCTIDGTCRGRLVQEVA